ncbi:hypothetical protein MP228_006390 [Amoeboaphelidium protococcarum]|nr:hypothetical protein MP228_006390 [Amoeboaphelidium protococcarum]
MPADRKHQQLPLNMADTRRSSQQQQLSDRKKSHGYASDQPSLLLSGEFKLYYMLFAVIHIISIPVMWNLSSMNNDSWFQFQHLLSDSWIFGSWRQIDNSDLQYSGFRTKIPILAVCLTLHVLLSRWTKFLDLRFQSTAVNYQHLFQIVFSLVFLYVLHGNGLLKILIILSINYMICRSLASVQTSWLMPLVVWMYCISVLYLNDQHSGYKFSHLHQSFAPLDDNNGLMSRWYVTFNITVLRMISYAMDYQWQLEAAADGSDQKLDSKHQTCVQCRQTGDKCDKYRAQRSRLPEEYSYVNYLQYCLYIPLYLAGPIITFNTYRSQLSQRSKKLEFKSTVVYGLRLAGVILLMETLMHMMYVVAIQKANAWQNLSGLQVAILSVYNLMFVWLKLLIIWRFFRFWALCDGIYPVENMVRCMYDSFSGIDFWRYWHQSYNKWIIRYLYIPNAKYVRQNIIISRYQFPELNALCNRFCLNIAGSVQYKREVYDGCLANVEVPGLKQIFIKVGNVSSHLDAEDARFQYLIDTIIPSVADQRKQSLNLAGGGKGLGCCIVVPTYLEFLKLRNWFEKLESDAEQYVDAPKPLSYVAISEYSSAGDISRSRSHFYHGKRDFMVVTERFHYFRRYRLRGIKQLVFSGPVANAHFYTEFASMLVDLKNTDADVDELLDRNSKVVVLYSKYDALALERIVGTSKLPKMIHGSKELFMFSTQ